MRTRVILLATAASCVAVAALGISRAIAPGPPSGPGAIDVRSSSADWSYVIPRGTGARLDLGQTVTILPARIDARVGDVIRIVNRDRRGYLLGPFYISAHTTLTQRFTSPGRFEGTCTVHPSGEIVLDVRA